MRVLQLNAFDGRERPVKCDACFLPKEEISLINPASFLKYSNKKLPLKIKVGAVSILQNKGIYATLIKGDSMSERKYLIYELSARAIIANAKLNEDGIYTFNLNSVSTEKSKVYTGLTNFYVINNNFIPDRVVPLSRLSFCPNIYANV